ncbi:MAG TPA: hypothetical protein VF263_26485, partial [Longimicrobiaceae bacterium]
WGSRRTPPPGARPWRWPATWPRARRSGRGRCAGRWSRGGRWGAPASCAWRPTCGAGVAAVRVGGDAVRVAEGRMRIPDGA